MSAGFDAYVNDPVASMSLEIDDFADLGRWTREAGMPVAAVLEGGYSSISLCSPMPILQLGRELKNSVTA